MDDWSNSTPGTRRRKSGIAAIPDGDYLPGVGRRTDLDELRQVFPGF
jgi:hypothetical protein